MQNWQEVKTCNSNLYPHLVKTMDNHYTASGRAWKIQQYLDRGMKSANTTSSDSMYNNQEHGHNCPFRHSPLAQAHVTATDDDTPSIDEQDFSYESNEMWWFVLRSSTVAIKYSNTRDLPHSSHCSSVLPLLSVVMLDSGCFTCIVPISQLSKETRKDITHSDVHMKQINDSIIALGELNCDITIGNHNSPVFKEINVLVTTQATPILISHNILGYNTLDSYFINNWNATVDFWRTLALGRYWTLYIYLCVCVCVWVYIYIYIYIVLNIFSQKKHQYEGALKKQWL